jgi:fructokinase
MGLGGFQGMKNNPVCIGSGLIALDVIYDNKKTKPNFLAGGSCGNVLTILSYLDWQSYPIARLGNDPEGKRIIEDMIKWGVKIKFVEHESGIHSPRIIEKIFPGKNPNHRFYFKCEHGNWLPQRKPYLLKSVETIQNKLPVPNVFYFDRSTPSALELAKNFKKQNAIIFFEPPKFLYDDNFIKCLQISDIVKHCYDQSEDTEKSGIKIPLEIQTKGEDGLQYRAQFLKQNNWKQMDAFPVENLVDAAGSGDWLSAGLIHVLLQNKSEFAPTEKKLEFALRFGQSLASLNCHFVGARGIMYNLSKSKLFSLVDDILKNKTSVSLNSSLKNPKITSLAKKCKVCLCYN